MRARPQPGVPASAPEQISIECGPVRLRPAAAADDVLLAGLLPDDFEHDPGFPRDPAHSLAEHRSAWMRHWLSSFRSPSEAEQFFPFVAEDLQTGEPVGFQLLERPWPVAGAPVDSSSFVIPARRGRGVGIAMRTAALGFAFEVLGARAAVSSASPSNIASRRVSERCGYRFLGKEASEAPSGSQVLARYGITAREWFREHCTVLSNGVLRVDPEKSNPALSEPCAE